MTTEEKRLITSYIKHLAVSGLSSISARIKSTCNLTGKCFEMPNVSYTRPLCAIQERQYLGRNQNKNCNFVVKFIN